MVFDAPGVAVVVGADDGVSLVDVDEHAAPIMANAAEAPANRATEREVLMGLPSRERSGDADDGKTGARRGTSGKTLLDP
jgi:hypothetical protein